MMSNLNLNSLWLETFKPNPDAKLKLFCFPYAGGGAGAFRQWWQFVPDDVEVIAVCPPGRERRTAEQAFDNLEALIAALYPAIKPQLNKPFIFLGHSLGALVSYELTRKLQREGEPLPEKLIVSAKCPPNIPNTSKNISALPDNAFMAELKEYNGTPEQILKNEELMAFFLPMLKADFGINDKYRFKDDLLLSCPVHVWYGEQDTMANQDMLKWLKLTSAPAGITAFNGGHFFIDSHPEQVKSALSALL